MKYVITLVHGTLAKHADWIQPDSTLSNNIRSNLPAPTLIEPFRWSGWNSPLSRFKAARDLKEHLLGLVNDYPNARHYIIAHSHGGNVVLEALRDSDLAPRISGVICLSTPFIYIEERQMKPLILWFLGGFIWLATFYATAAAIFFATRKMGMNVSEVWPMALSMALACPPAILLPSLWGRYGRALLPKMQQPTFPQEKVLIIRFTGDEAALLLAASQFAVFAMSKIMSIAKSFVIIVFKGFEILYVWWAKFLGKITFGYDRWFQIAICVPMAFLPFFSGQVKVNWSDAVISFVSSASLAIALLKYETVVVYRALIRLPACLYLAILGFLLSPVIAALILIAMVPLGPRLAWYHPFLDISVDSSPPGVWTIHQLTPLQRTTISVWKWFEIPVREEFSPLHSSSYQDPRALRIITDWIGESM